MPCFFNCTCYSSTGSTVTVSHAGAVSQEAVNYCIMGLLSNFNKISSNLFRNYRSIDLEISTTLTTSSKREATCKRKANKQQGNERNASTSHRGGRKCESSRWSASRWRWWWPTEGDLHVQGPVDSIFSCVVASVSVVVEETLSFIHFYSWP